MGKSPKPSNGEYSNAEIEPRRRQTSKLEEGNDFDQTSNPTGKNSNQKENSKKTKKFVKPGGVKSTTINLLISTLGPGMVTLPTAFLMSGMFGGFMWFLLATIVS